MGAGGAGRCAMSSAADQVPTLPSLSIALARTLMSAATYLADVLGVATSTPWPNQPPPNRPEPKG